MLVPIYVRLGKNFDGFVGMNFAIVERQNIFVIFACLVNKGFCIDRRTV